MSVFIPVSTLVRLVFWLAAVAIVVGVLIGAQRPADTNTSPELAPTTTVQPTGDQPVVEAAAAGER